jgi:hypothetical protein
MDLGPTGELQIKAACPQSVLRMRKYLFQPESVDPLSWITDPDPGRQIIYGPAESEAFLDIFGTIEILKKYVVTYPVHSKLLNIMKHWSFFSEISLNLW